MARQDEETEAENTPAAGHNKIVVIAVAMVVSAAIIGGGLFWGLKGHSAPAGGEAGTEKKAEPVVKKEMPVIYPLEAFIVNIGDGRDMRYLKVKVELETALSAENAKKELDPYLPRLRDSVLVLLTTKTIQDVQDLPGKNRLREEILAAAKKTMPSGRSAVSTLPTSLCSDPIREGTMEKILNKEEIEALLAAVADGSLDPDKELARERGGVANYDLFSSAAHKGLVPNLDIVYDSFIRYHRVSMSNQLRKLVEIRKVGARPYKFDDFLMTLPSPVCMGIYKIEPLKGASLLAMDNNLVFAILESVLGGTGTTCNPDSKRSFTSIELRIMQKFVKSALLDMEKAWAPLYPTKMSLLRMDINPRLVNIVPPEYQVITMELKYRSRTSPEAWSVPFPT